MIARIQRKHKDADVVRAIVYGYDSLGLLILGNAAIQYRGLGADASPNSVADARLSFSWSHQIASDQYSSERQFHQAPRFPASMA